MPSGTQSSQPPYARLALKRNAARRQNERELVDSRLRETESQPLPTAPRHQPSLLASSAITNTPPAVVARRHG